MGTCRRLIFAEMNLETQSGKENLFKYFARDLVNSTSKFKP